MQCYVTKQPETHCLIIVSQQYKPVGYSSTHTPLVHFLQSADYCTSSDRTDRQAEQQFQGTKVLGAGSLQEPVLYSHYKSSHYKSSWECRFAKFHYSSGTKTILCQPTHGMSDWTLVVLLVRLCFLELYNLWSYIMCYKRLIHDRPWEVIVLRTWVYSPSFTPVLICNNHKDQVVFITGKTMLIIRVSGFYLHPTCKTFNNKTIKRYKVI